MREHAYRIVCGTLEQGGHSDVLFHQCLFEHPDLASVDKGFIKRLAFGTIERCPELDARIRKVSSLAVEKMESSVRTILRMAVYEIVYMEQIPVPVSCNEAVELAKRRESGRYASFVNGVLRNVVRESENFVIESDAVRYSLPEELMDHLTARYGRKTARKIGAAFLERTGAVTIHVDTNKISAAAYKRLLEEQGIAAQFGFYMPDAIVIERSPDITQLPGYQEGWFFVQDESSMLPVLCAGIEPGHCVADVCGAPGGKAIHTLIRLRGEGKLIVRDVKAKKVERIRENIRRMQYDNVICECRDARCEDAANRGKMDVVLADVPCSGIGIIGRKPEIKYHAMEQIKELVILQRDICRRAVQLLKPGGIFLYSTCTVSPAENEENVAWLEENLELRRSSLDEFLPDVLKNKMTKQGMLQMLPGIQNSDGFFVARLEKTR